MSATSMALLMLASGRTPRKNGNVPRLGAADEVLDRRIRRVEVRIDERRQVRAARCTGTTPTR